MKQTIQKIIRTKEYQKLKRLILGYIWGRIKLKVQNFLNKEQGGIIDVVDDRDIKYEDIEIVMGEVPEVFGKRSLENIQNQRHSPTFPGSSCGPHSMSHAMQISGVVNAPTGPEFSKQMQDAGLLHSWGSYLIDNPKFARKQGYITGYARISTKEQMMKHLATGQAVLIGSDKLKFNWSIEKQRYEYFPATSFGHLWAMDTFYDKEGVWCVDSLVLNNMLKFLKWEDIDRLFPSRVAIFVDKRFNIINEVKKDTPEVMNIMREKYPTEQSARMRAIAFFNRKYKDKQAVEVGFRLGLGMSIKGYKLD